MTIPTTTTRCPECNSMMFWHYSFPVTMELDSPYKHVFRCLSHMHLGTIETSSEPATVDDDPYDEEMEAEGLGPLADEAEIDEWADDANDYDYQS